MIKEIETIIIIEIANIIIAIGIIEIRTKVIIEIETKVIIKIRVITDMIINTKIIMIDKRIIETLIIIMRKGFLHKIS